MVSDEADEDDDLFFYYLMLTVPLLALAAYIYDASILLMSNDETGGLLSSILFIFYFLQYSVTIDSKWLLTAYQFLIWIMVTAGDVLYILYYLRKNNQVQLIRYIGYILLDFVFILALWSCKMMVVCKAHDKNCWCCIKVFQSLRLDPNLRLYITVRQRQFFSFVSRLEAILATLIPIFFSDKIVQTTSANIGFFILFDFFYTSYYKLGSVWIKVCLYLFVATVTGSLAIEWLYYVKLEIVYSQVSSILEFLATCWCCTFIIMQFFPSHFRAKYRQI
jgi:hypothetical protein